MENDDVSQPSSNSNEEPNPPSGAAEAATDVAVISDHHQESGEDRREDPQQQDEDGARPEQEGAGEEAPTSNHHHSATALIWKKRNIWLEEEGSFSIIENEVEEDEVRAATAIPTSTTTTSQYANYTYGGTRGYQQNTTTMMKRGVGRIVGKMAPPLSRAKKTKYDVKRGKKARHPVVVAVGRVPAREEDSTSTTSTSSSHHSLAPAAEQGESSLDTTLPPARFSLVPTDSRTIQDEAAKLTTFNRLTVEALDLYQVTADDLPLLAARRKKSLTNVPVGSVGIRCRYCAANDATMTTVGSLLFPGRLSSLSAILYHMRDRHLVGTECPHLPLSVHTRFRALQQASTGAGSRGGRQGQPVVGLPSYLRVVMEHYHVVDNPQGNGIVVRRDYRAQQQRRERVVVESPQQHEQEKEL